MPDTIFSIKNINFSIGNLKILKNVSLNINDNDFIVLLGPSGSGKSTLLRMLNCLNSPTSGEIFFHNQLSSGYDIAELRKKVGMVFQSPTMINGSVKENLTLTQQWKKSDNSINDSDLITTLKQVGLDSSFLKKDAKSLSGGEQQRIALARVLLNKPEVLLLDEPTANLDPQLAQKILKLVFDLYQKLGLTVVLVSHHHSEIVKFAKQVVILIDGIIVEQGGSEIIKNPASDVAKAFMVKESG
jgi:ABC-type methionine transport system ATPase subunit